MEIRVQAASSPALREKAYALRHEVFVTEQKVPVELERDEQDDAAFHAVALLGDRCVGTGRMYRQEPGVGRVGRMAVASDLRRRGVGDLVLRALEERARGEGLREIELHAQCYVEAFYARRGYERLGAPFVEAGIDHVAMRKKL